MFFHDKVAKSILYDRVYLYFARLYYNYARILSYNERVLLHYDRLRFFMRKPMAI